MAKSNGRLWRRANECHVEIGDHLVRTIARSPIGVTVQRRDLTYRFILNLPDLWALPEHGEPTDAKLFGPEIAARIGERKASLLANGGQDMLTIEAHERFFEFSFDAGHAPGNVDIVTTIVEVTEDRRRERVLRALLRELSHRSKNLLAIIQGIATQTGKHSTTVDMFIRKFQGRMHALSGSQDLLSDSNWRGARLRLLAARQLGRVVPDPHAIALEGEDLHLSANEALHIGLALHELAVNSASHGALARGADGIRLSARSYVIDGVGCGEVLWEEETGLKGADLETGRDIKYRNGRFFGSAVLERIVPTAVNGVADYRVLPARVSWRLRYPVSDAVADHVVGEG